MLLNPAELEVIAAQKHIGYFLDHSFEGIISEFVSTCVLETGDYDSKQGLYQIQHAARNERGKRMTRRSC